MRSIAVLDGALAEKTIRENRELLNISGRRDEVGSS